MVFCIARRAAGERGGIVAALMTALYPPLPYFGSLILTELWTAFMATAAILVCLRAAQQGRLRDYVLAGALFSATTLVRPAFVLMPFFFAIAVPMLVRSQRTPAALKGWAALVVTAALALTPWFAYNYVNLGQITLSPAGGIGRGLWEGSWQGRWSGRLQAELIDLADEHPRSRGVESPRDRQGPRDCDCRGADAAVRQRVARHPRDLGHAHRSDGARPGPRRRRSRISASRDREHAAPIRSGT